MFDISWENAFMFEVISEMFGDCVMVRDWLSMRKCRSGKWYG